MKSMTAYAHVYKKEKTQNLQVVLRSLNFKYLDIAIHNLPPEAILLEEKIKKEIKKKIYRGKIEVYIFQKKPGESKIHIDETNLADYIAHIRRLAKKYNFKADLSMRDLLSLPQVVYSEEKSQSEDGLILPAVKEGVVKLLEFRKKQGRIIRHEVLKNLKQLKDHVSAIKKNKPPVSNGTNNKDDIDEEISLMSFYLNKLGSKVGAKSALPKGKALDFLTQEILRELNAASSKTKAKKVALLIVEAKSYLERIREQAQNIE